MKLLVKSSDILSQISDLLTSSNLVPEGLDKDNLMLFWEPSEARDVDGVIGVETYGDSCLLRSLAVRDNKRNQGIARNLIGEALEFAYLCNSFNVYLITETVGDTMLRYGFSNITREEVPEDILRSPFFNGICHCSCKIMYKDISDSTFRVEKKTETAFNGRVYGLGE